MCSSGPNRGNASRGVDRRRVRRRDRRDHRPARLGCAEAVPARAAGCRAIDSYQTFLTWRGFLERPPSPRLRNRPRRPSFRADVEVRVHGVTVRGVRRAAPPSGVGVRGAPRSTRWSLSACPTSWPPWPPSPSTVSPTARARRWCRGARLRRRWSLPVRAHRCRCRTVAIGDRVEMTFRRISTSAGSTTSGRPTHRRAAIRGEPWPVRDQRSGRHRRDGVHRLRRALEQERRRPPRRRHQISTSHHKTRSTRFWLGTMGSGVSGLTLSRPCRSTTSRSGSRTCAPPAPSRSAMPATRRSGAYDFVMAVGVEKLKDSGFSGLTGSGRRATAPTRHHRAPRCSAARPGLRQEVRRRRRQFKEVLPASRGRTTRTAPSTRGPVPARMSKETIACSPLMAGTSASSTARACPTAAAAIVVRAEDVPVHRQAALREGAVVRGRQRPRHRRPRLRLHDVP